MATIIGSIGSSESLAATATPRPSVPRPEGALLVHLTHWIFVVTALWLVFGLLGSALSASRGEWARARRGIITLVLVAAIYLGLLLGFSLRQPAHIVSPAQSRCFDQLCFQVIAVDEPTGFQARAPNVYASPLPDQSQTPDRLVRLRIRITNLDPLHADSELGLTAFLVDAQGRHWQQLPGLAGVPLSSRVQSRGSATSSPVFRIAPDSSGLHLILRHVGWYSGRLTLGDPESLLHRPEEMILPKEESVRP